MNYELNIFTRHTGFEDTPTRNFLNLIQNIYCLLECDADDYAERIPIHYEGYIDKFYNKLTPVYLEFLERVLPNFRKLLYRDTCKDYEDEFMEFYDKLGYQMVDLREELITVARTKMMKEELITVAMCPDRIDSIVKRFGKKGVIDTFG